MYRISRHARGSYDIFILCCDLIDKRDASCVWSKLEEKDVFSVFPLSDDLVKTICKLYQRGLLSSWVSLTETSRYKGCTKVIPCKRDLTRGPSTRHKGTRPVVSDSVDVVSYPLLSVLGDRST